TVEVALVTMDVVQAARHPGLKPGPHVLLSVIDTGTGMDEATQARIFEPFFTTKGVGKGTGLGLSTVFGIVRQSAGAISLQSTPGKGSTFGVVLPAAGGTLERHDRRAVEPDDLRGSETILLVEDEDGVRRAARSILERSGYRVLEAQNGGEALRTAESHPQVDLLLSDVVMPRMSGPQLAARLRSARPGLKVLYMSGYNENAMVLNDLLLPDTALLQKPLMPLSLLTSVRELLSRTGASAARGATRVLLVDDEPLMRRLLAHMLGNCRIEASALARDALARIEGGERFDVVLCDLNMPDMNGMRFYQSLAARDAGLARRVLFVTGGALDLEAERFLAGMPGRVLQKPVDARTLRAAVSAVLAGGPEAVN
ncbi:MAG TPA: response regulator, partial [Myxococcales bacterium]|nr:response regulator [Myxococcales bacterium]